MRKKQRRFCPYCRTPIKQEAENGIERDFCQQCRIFFYDNPLPVVSAIVVENRRVILVKRKNNPYKNKWCLPSGFAESGESVAEAAIRELEEEAGIKGRVISLIDVDSIANHFYGDLLFLTFEIERIGGQLTAGDDASDVKYFPIEKTPKLAFSSNIKAVEAYIDLKKESWEIIDSFNQAIEETMIKKGPLLSDRIVILVEKNAEHIARMWLADVTTNRSTPTYHTFDRQKLYNMVLDMTAHFHNWLSGTYGNSDIRSRYMRLGIERKAEGFTLSEVISALSLAKKHIWEFALSKGMWEKTIDIYMELELNRRINLFFDKAVFNITKGYEK